MRSRSPSRLRSNEKMSVRPSDRLSVAAALASCGRVLSVRSSHSNLRGSNNCFRGASDVPPGYLPSHFAAS